MKKIATNQLLDQLKSDTRSIILNAKRLQRIDPEILLRQPAADKWSIIQILEHLNAYGRYYLPAIHSALQKNTIPADTTYTSGWLGGYLTNSMKPTADKRIKNKMKAMKDYSPSPDLDSKTVMEEFLNQQQQLLDLLESARQHNIGRIRIPVSIAKFIKLKLGDTFRFVIAHNERHIVQSENVLSLIQSAPSTLAY